MPAAVLADLYLIKLVKELSGFKPSEAVALGREMVASHDGPESLVALAEALIADEQHQEAVNVLRAEMNKFGNEVPQMLKEAMQKAEVALKQSKEKDYYKILGVARGAAKSEIKKVSYGPAAHELYIF